VNCRLPQGERPADRLTWRPLPITQPIWPIEPSNEHFLALECDSQETIRSVYEPEFVSRESGGPEEWPLGACTICG
jgi:hypothetical protein